MSLVSWKILVLCVLLEKHLIVKQVYQVEGLPLENGLTMNSRKLKSEASEDSFLPEDLSNERILTDKYKETHASNISPHKTILESELRTMDRNKYQYYPDVSSRRRRYLGHFQPINYQNPYFPVKREIKASKFEKIELNPDQIDQNTLQNVIGLQKKSEIPQCSIGEYESIEKWEYMPFFKRPEHFQKPRDVNFADFIRRNEQKISGYKRNHWGIPIRKNNLNFKKLLSQNQLHEKTSENLNDIKHNLKRSTGVKNITNQLNTSVAAGLHQDGSNMSESAQKITHYQNVSIFNDGSKVNDIVVNSECTPLGTAGIKDSPSIVVLKNENLPEFYIQLSSSNPLEIIQNKPTGNSTEYSVNLKDISASYLIHNPVKGVELNSQNTTGPPVGYIYLQQMPMNDPVYIQRMKNIHSNVSTLSDLGDDTITIMINPKTLKNKILHAEYLKKTEEKKNPDTLIIDLKPMNSTSDFNELNLRSRRDVKSIDLDYNDFFESVQPFHAPLNYPVANKILQASSGRQDGVRYGPSESVISLHKSGVGNVSGLKESEELQKGGTCETTCSDCCSTTTAEVGMKNFKEIHEGIVAGQRLQEDMMRMLGGNEARDERGVFDGSNAEALKMLSLDSNGGGMMQAESGRLQLNTRDLRVGDQAPREADTRGLRDVVLDVQPGRLQEDKNALQPEPVARDPRMKALSVQADVRGHPNAAPEALREDVLNPQAEAGKLSRSNAKPNNLENEAIQQLAEERQHAGFNDLYRVNPKWLNECSSIAYGNMCPTTKKDKCIKRDAHLKNRQPIIIMYPKSGEDSKDSFDYESSFKDEGDLRGEALAASKIANKKVENTILEGFINSIISNYSKDTHSSTPKIIEEADKSEEGEGVMNILKGLLTRRNQDDRLHLMPIIVPQDNLAHFKDNEDYTKYGPFSEDLIKSILKEDNIQLIKTEIK